MSDGIRTTDLPALDAPTGTDRLLGMKGGVGTYTVTQLATYANAGREVLPETAMGDGTTDDTAALQAALTQAITEGRVLRLPAGDYLLRAKLTANASSPVVIRGDGQGLTRLIWAVDSTSEGIDLTLATDRDTVLIEGLSLLTYRTRGTALQLDFSPQIDPVTHLIMDRTTPRYIVSRVFMAGAGDVFNSGWSVGVEAIAAVYGACIDCAFTGWLATYVPGASFVPGSSDAFLSRGSDGSTNMTLQNGRPVVSLHDRCAVNYAERGIRFVGYEGAYVRACNMVGVNYGVVWQDSLGRPQLNISDTHINAYTASIYAENVCQLTAQGCLCYRPIDAPGTVYGIWIKKNGSPGFGHGYFTITSCTFQDTAAGTSLFNAIYIQDGDYGSVEGNTFRKVSTGVWLGTGTSNILVGDANVYDSAEVATVLDEGTNNAVAEASIAANGFARTAQGVETKWGTALVTLNSGGNGVITFPSGFSGPLFVALVGNGDPTKQPGAAFTVNNASSNNSTIAFTVTPNPGAVQVQVNYIAVGVP